jgi:pentatricopeptide repeat protein
MIRSVFKILIVLFLVAVAIAAYQVQGFVEFRFLGIASKINIGEFFLALLVLLVVLFYFLELLRFSSRLSSNITRYWRKRQKKEAERYLGEAVSLMESESYDEAFRKIKRAREVLKGSLLVKWVYARLVVALGAFDEAVVSELLSSESLVLAAHRLKIERLLKQGNYTDVVEHAVAALKINPSSLWFLNTLFSVYVRLSELDKALDLAKKMSGHGHSSAAHKMALCYFLLSHAESDVGKKIKQLELAVDLDKTSANITAELAAVYINMGKHKKAQEVIEKVWKHTRSSFLGERFLEAVSTLNSEERLC